MATNQNNDIKTHLFQKGLLKDMANGFDPDGVWLHGRNLANNTKKGDFGGVGNEPSNSFCAKAPYEIIGAIHLTSDNWVIFSTDDTNSEIGVFDESECSYTTTVNDPCLNFNRQNLITGDSKQMDDCSYQVYWSDKARNYDRTMNITNPPFKQLCLDSNGNDPSSPLYPVGCITCTNTTDLDCDKIRLARVVKTPCITVQKGPIAGTLLNGSYYAVIAYSIKQNKVTDYFMPSNVQSIFDHDNAGGSLQITIGSLDTEHFSEFELVIVSTFNQQTVAKKMGYYSTHESQLTFDQIKNDLVSMPIEFIPIRNPVYDRSDAIFKNGEYLLRAAPRSSFDFNYQPLANQIVVKWCNVEYPADYYQKGGNQTAYLRDEVYPLFIRYVRDTGERTSSWVIPGRAERIYPPLGLLETANAPVTADAIEYPQGITPAVFEVYNTAFITALPGTVLPDGGIVVAEGLMAYHESTEKYPDDKPQVWDASSQFWSGTTNPDYDLCGKPIRHHKFPDNFIDQVNAASNHINIGASRIRIMAVRFENIKPPLDNNGVLIPGIVGYEILRGSREGNKTVIAKGIINNCGTYSIEGGTSGRQGLYPNYPYNDLNNDAFLSTTKTSADMFTGNPQNVNPYNNFSSSLFTFHSPDTQFKNPFLSSRELKIYGQLEGAVEGQYVEPKQHPKHKHITNFTYLLASFVGIAGALTALNGAKRTQRLLPRKIDLGGIGLGTSTFTIPGVLGPAAQVGVDALQVYIDTQNGVYYTGLGAQIPLTAVTGLSDQAYMAGLDLTAATVSLLPATLGASEVIEKENGIYDLVPLAIRVLQAIPMFGYYMSEGSETFLRLVKAFMPYKQYVLQYQSHGFYDNINAPQAANNRRFISDSIYLTPNLQDFGASFRVNNLFRGRSVLLSLSAGLASPLAVGGPNVVPAYNTVDNTRQRIADNPMGAVNPYDEPTAPFKTVTKCHYAALKQRLRNQYGQIDSIKQVPVSVCTTEITDAEFLANLLNPSAVFFNGDTYVARYTEKNTFFYFYDWMHMLPDGYEFDYLKVRMLPYPTYWMDTTHHDVNELFGSIAGNPFTPGAWQLPSKSRVFDRDTTFGTSVFQVQKAFMYLSSSGVRDFFVESEINTDLRDWGENIEQKHYSANGLPTSDVQALFDANPVVLKSGNYFKYDISLSISRLFNNLISWGAVQPRYYDPLIAQSCYTYYSKRLIYSLPQKSELRQDNWFIYLANNYKDFGSKVLAVKPINLSGAIIFFESSSPVMFQGVDTLSTDIGTKITIGDGGLFSQPLQNVVNAESSYEYGACQSLMSIINTPAGLFYICQNQGKIYQIGNGLNEISARNIKFWLEEYMPYRILEDFPTFSLLDNPVVGVGCQSMYDSLYGIVYFCKKDYKLKPNLPVIITYVSGNDFLVNGITPIKLGDSRYFEDASWTLSYDTKERIWVSHHDWHPTYAISSKEHFMSVSKDGIWKHNDRCDSFCNFYGVDYPFEIEYAQATGQAVNILKSLEWFMECYRYQNNCFDKFHVLDWCFDELIITNTEQVSGVLRLNLTPKNNVADLLGYPVINPTSVDILFSKEEQRYRADQFWDITADRGEFNLIAQRPIWITSENGYNKVLNPVNLDYNKAELERKKFRHYVQNLLFKRKISGNTKIILLFVNQKDAYSPR